MFAILPLAFVEPEEKQLKKAPKKHQLAVFAAGPFSNILTAVLTALFIIFVLAPATNSILDFDGIDVESVVENSPVAKAGLEAGDLLVAIDGIEINETNLNELLSSRAPGDEVIFHTTEKELTVVPVQHKDDGMKPYYGIFMKSRVKLKDHIQDRFGQFPWALMYILQFFNWFFTLSLGIGLANLLPLGPVDGGRITLVSLSKFFKQEKAVKFWKHISWFILLLLIINIAFPLIKKLIHPSL